MAAAGVGMTFAMGLRTARRMRGAASGVVAGIIFVTVGVLRWPMLPMALTLGPLSVWLAWHGARRRLPHG